jgi:hypothetical protein
MNLRASIGTFSRKQAPDGDVSSIFAGAVSTVSSQSSHETLATAIIAFLGSPAPRVALTMSTDIGRKIPRFSLFPIRIQNNFLVFARRSRPQAAAIAASSPSLLNLASSIPR